MRLTIDTKTLKWGLASVGRASVKNGPMPILSAVRIQVHDGFLTMKTTNLETTASAKIPTETGNAGIFAVDHGLITATASAITADHIVMTVLDTSMVMEAPGVKVTMNLLDANDFPAMSDLSGEAATTIDSATLVDVLQRTIVTVASDNLRPVLAGVLLSPEPGGACIAASSDGFRLTAMTFASTALTNDVVVPTMCISEIIRIASTTDSVELRISDRMIDVRTVDGTQQITGRLIDGKYPNVRAILARTAGYETLKLPTSKVLSAVRLCRLYVDKAAPSGTISMHERVTGGCSMRMQSEGDRGNVVQEVDVDGGLNQDVSITLTLAFLEAALKSVKTGLATLAVKSKMDPVIVSEETDTYTYQHVIMPMNR